MMYFVGNFLFILLDSIGCTHCLQVFFFWTITCLVYSWELFCIKLRVASPLVSLMFRAVLWHDHLSYLKMFLCHNPSVHLSDYHEEAFTHHNLFPMPSWFLSSPVDQMTIRYERVVFIHLNYICTSAFSPTVTQSRSQHFPQHHFILTTALWGRLGWKEKLGQGHPGWQ